MQLQRGENSTRRKGLTPVDTEDSGIHICQASREPLFVPDPFRPAATPAESAGHLDQQADPREPFPFRTIRCVPPHFERLVRIEDSSRQKDIAWAFKVQRAA
jgi:hypothetical protein